MLLSFNGIFRIHARPGFSHPGLRFVRSGLLALLLLALGSLELLPAQTRATFFDEPAEIRLPDAYNPQRAYPVMIFLPFTGGSANQFFTRHRHLPGLVRDYIILMPAGRPVAADYLPDFPSFVRWYEEMLLRELARLERLHRIDSERIALGGFSLGGDLAWSLLLRNPGRFRGAVMAGTRASYPPPRGALEILAQRDFRAAFVSGEEELDIRLRGIRAAHGRILSQGLPTVLRLRPGRGHVSAEPRDFLQLMQWASGSQVTSFEVLSQPERGSQRSEASDQEDPAQGTPEGKPAPQRTLTRDVPVDDRHPLLSIDVRDIPGQSQVSARLRNLSGRRVERIESDIPERNPVFDTSIHTSNFANGTEVRLVLPERIRLTVVLADGHRIALPRLINQVLIILNPDGTFRGTLASNQ